MNSYLVQRLEQPEKCHTCPCNAWGTVVVSQTEAPRSCGAHLGRTINQAYLRRPR